MLQESCSSVILSADGGDPHLRGEKTLQTMRIQEMNRDGKDRMKIIKKGGNTYYQE